MLLLDPTLILRNPRWLQNHLQAYERWELDPDHQPPVSLSTQRFHVFTEQLPFMEPGMVCVMTAAAHSSPALPPRGLYAAMLEELFAPGGAVDGDVVDKLVRHCGHQRHAFVWGEAPEHAGFGLLRRLQPGDLHDEPHPELPEGPTHVWLALNQPSAVLLWARDQGWQVHRPGEIRPADAFDCPVHDTTR